MLNLIKIIFFKVDEANTCDIITESYSGQSDNGVVDTLCVGPFVPLMKQYCREYYCYCHQKWMCYEKSVVQKTVLIVITRHPFPLGDIVHMAQYYIYSSYN